MTRDRDRHDTTRPAQTATDEVLDEIEDAETDPLRDDKEAPHRGESADATSPNVDAQKDVEGD
ncbi:hypothetical protein [Streptomyces sp. NPDC016845]|uniref:hypothetical protein n=1 Tax=Streptomyces sp. NPDC016845 TaxID=3364972 RepID=UPI0037A405A3